MCHVGFRAKDVRNESTRVPESPLYLRNWLSNGGKKLYVFLIEQTIFTLSDTYTHKCSLHTNAALSLGRMKPVGGIL